MAQHNLFGQEAEQKALSFLCNKVYVLLEKNYRFGKAEIDLLMKDSALIERLQRGARATALAEYDQELNFKRIKSVLEGVL